MSTRLLGTSVHLLHSMIILTYIPFEVRYPLKNDFIKNHWSEVENRTKVWLGAFHKECQILRRGKGGTVCWIEVKLAVLCARQYMPWNLLLIKVLNNFWYFKHQILTRISSEAYLKCKWRNCLWKKLQILKTFL